jgi:hypothetical protein
VVGVGQFSPDGHWILYQSNESGRYEIFVSPFPNGAGSKQQISTNGGTWPQWRKDGRELYYFAPQGRKLMAVAVQSGDGSLRFGSERVLMAPVQTIMEYQPSADGQRFLLRLRNPKVANLPLTVVQNWTAALKR